MKKLTSQLGFTMIELLIVITILGILAVAVLSAINPIEQINRGRDTSSQSDAEQLLSGIDRFNAFQGYYPWQLDANDLDTSLMASAYTITSTSAEWTRLTAEDSPDIDTQGIPVPVTLRGETAFPEITWVDGEDTFTCSIMERLSSGNEEVHATMCRGSQELKDSFVTRIYNPSTRDLYIYNSGVPGGSTYVCFIPQSGAFEVAASERCEDGLPEDVGAWAEGFICNQLVNDANPRDGIIDSTVEMSCLP